MQKDLKSTSKSTVLHRHPIKYGFSCLGTLHLFASLFSKCVGSTRISCNPVFLIQCPHWTLPVSVALHHSEFLHEITQYPSKKATSLPCPLPILRKCQPSYAVEKKKNCFHFLQLWLVMSRSLLPLYCKLSVCDYWMIGVFYDSFFVENQMN